MERKIYFGCLIGILIYIPSLSQSPQSFKYQSVARNSNGDPMDNTALGIRISIRDLTESGTILYQETHSVSTNSLGLFSISVGNGNVASGNFRSIDWSSGAKFIDVEADFTGGSSYISMGVSQLLSVPYALYAESGRNGKNGLNILNGTADPSSGAGVDGEFYINTTTQTIFGPKTSGAWPTGIPLVGPAGVAGTNGTNGTNGLNVLNGTSDPTSGIGVNGEFYINTSSNKIFGPKTSGAWPTGIPLVGPAGVAGTNGTNGTNGLNVLNGTSDPTSGIGVNGEFYINTSSNKIFGPKTSGAWPAGVSLVGPPGSATNAWGLTGNSGTVDGTNFIGTTDDVPLNLKVNNLRAGRVSSIGEAFLGYRAGEVNSGADNVGLGYLALQANTTGYRNTSTGSQSLKANTSGNGNSSYGYASLFTNTSGYGNTAIGVASMYQNGTGFLNSAVGQSSLWMNTTGAYNSALGYFSLGLNSSGMFNSALGSNSLGSNTTGNNNTAVGEYSLYSSTGNNNTAVGFQAGYTANSANANNSGSNNTFIGYNSGPGTTTQLTNATAIGYQSIVSSNNSLVLGGVGADAVKIGIGVSSPGATLDLLGNIKIADGTQGTGKVLTSDANGVASWATLGAGAGSGWSLTGNSGTVDGTNFIGTTDAQPLSIRTNNLLKARITTKGQLEILNTGYSLFVGEGAGANEDLNNRLNIFLGSQAGASTTSGYGNIGTGLEALYTNTTGNYNAAYGLRSLNRNTTGFENIAIGNLSLYSNTTGNDNIAIGVNSLYTNSTGSLNIASGYGSLFYNTTGSNNVALGYFANYYNTTGNNNTLLGYNAGTTSIPGNANTTGSNNTFIGYNSGPGTSTQLTNAIAIGYNALVSASNSLVLGGTGADAVKVGIGVTTPAAVLDVAGNVKIADGTQGTGKVLTSDANGLASWATPGASSGWSLTGNSGTVDGTNFIGTTDNVPLNFRIFNQPSGRIDLNNLFLGNSSGASNTAVGNVGLGANSMFANTTGISNTATGFTALYSNTTGSWNVANGYGALYANTTGQENTAIGYHALYASPTGSYNSALGGRALENNTTGISNTATGMETLTMNTSGSYNTANGADALFTNTTGQSNVAVGAFALNSNTSGSVNTAIGSEALYANADGTVNVAVGYRSLYSNTSGAGNVAVGNIALNFNTTGGGNTATGWNSLYNNIDGADNTAVGRASLGSNTSGSSNVGIGVSAAFSSTTGSNNTSIGFESLYGNTIGDNNTAVGYRALTSIASNFSNSTAVGYNAQVTASNMIRLGDANVTSINGAVDFTVVSDRRFKKDIKENVSGLSFIMKLRPVTYHIDMNEMAKFLNTPNNLRIKELEENKEKVLQTGFIAQEVEKVAHDLGYDFSGVDKPKSKGDFYGLRYAEFTVPLVKAVQEQQNIIDSLRKEILVLKEQFHQTQQRQEELKSENTSLKETIEVRVKKLEEAVNIAARK
jgi:hypothetical protein